MKTLEDRDLDPETSDIHLGFDGGQGFLKIGFTVTERPNSEDKKVFSLSKYIFYKYIHRRPRKMMPNSHQ